MTRSPVETPGVLTNQTEEAVLFPLGRQSPGRIVGEMAIVFGPSLSGHDPGIAGGRRFRESRDGESARRPNPVSDRAGLTI